MHMSVDAEMKWQIVRQGIGSANKCVLQIALEPYSVFLFVCCLLSCSLTAVVLTSDTAIDEGTFAVHTNIITTACIRVVLSFNFDIFCETTFELVKQTNRHLRITPPSSSRKM